MHKIPIPSRDWPNPDPDKTQSRTNAIRDITKLWSKQTFSKLRANLEYTAAIKNFFVENFQKKTVDSFYNSYISCFNVLLIFI